MTLISGKLRWLAFLLRHEYDQRFHKAIQKEALLEVKNPSDDPSIAALLKPFVPQ